MSLAFVDGGAVARLYRVGPGEAPFFPPSRRQGKIDVHGLGPLHWALLTLLAEHGAMNTEQVTGLLFGSRPAASRRLTALTKAGLVWRFVDDDDPAHMAHYELSADGAQALADHLRRAGRPVPATLGEQHSDHFPVAEFYIGLATESRSGGPGCLYRWRGALDTVTWLRGQGIEQVHPRANGVWIEAGSAIRFLLHIDHGAPNSLGDPPAPPSLALTGYRHAERGVPVTAILVITIIDGREEALHRELAETSLPVTVATAHRDRLNRVRNAAEPVWRVAGADAAGLVRLIDIPRQ